jgi:nucleoside-diphosphate-sugar epimerase
MKRVLVTGANGFIGTKLCKKLLNKNFCVHGAVRPGKSSFLPEGAEAVHIKFIDGDTDWKNILENIHTVVHLAARVHVMKDSVSNPFDEYFKVNVMGSERLAQTAAECGVKRFIFMSSVKVNGEENVRAYNEGDVPFPKDSYGISKMIAENRLRDIASKTGMELVILRPPLVYGPGVKANFLNLIKTVHKGRPLPLSKVYNRRSFIYIDNLVDAVITCIEHPGAAGQTYFVSDDEDISTPDLIRKIASALNKSPRIFPFPRLLLFTIGKIIGKGASVEKLIGSLTVDISKIRQELGWKPTVTMDYGLQETAEWYFNVYGEKKK